MSNKTNIMLLWNLMRITEDEYACAVNQLMIQFSGEILLKTEMAGKEQSNKIQSLQQSVDYLIPDKDMPETASYPH